MENVAIVDGDVRSADLAILSQAVALMDCNECEVQPQAEAVAEVVGEAKKKQKLKPDLAYVFNAQRQDIVDTINKEVKEDLIDAHNAECEDIRREAEEIGKSNRARATTRKRARILRLVAKRHQCENNLRTKFALELNAAAKDLGGEISESVDPNVPSRKVTKVMFPDGSESRIPRGLFIPYDQLQKA